MSAKHTPGNWYADADAMTVSTDAEISGDIVCEAPEGMDHSMQFWPANARLIAAAPDLLTFAHLIVHYADVVRSGKSGITPGQWDMFVKDARAALSKAGATI